MYEHDNDHEVSKETREEKLKRLRYDSDSVAEKYFDLEFYVDDVIQRTYDIEWLIPNLLERNTVAILYGEAETYKSFLALYIGFLLAQGHSVLKSNIQGNAFVKYVALEMPHQHTPRLKALNEKFRYLGDDDDVQEQGFHMGLFSMSEKHFTMGKDNLEEIVAFEHIANTYELIIIDTLSYLFPDQDESKAHVVRGVMHELNRIASEKKCTILCIHHPTKANNQIIRGSSEINNAVNTIIHNNGRQLRVKKQRNGKSGQRYDYVMNYVEKFDTLIPEFTNSRKKHDAKIESLLTIIESKPDSIISRTELREEWLKVHGVENQSTNNTNFSRALKKAVSDGLIKIETENEDEIVSINEV